MKKLDSQEELAMLKNLVYVSLISADNDEFSEEVKQEVLQRHKKASEGYKSPTDSSIDWEYVFEPLGDKAHRYAEIMKAE